MRGLSNERATITGVGKSIISAGSASNCVMTVGMSDKMPGIPSANSTRKVLPKRVDPVVFLVEVVIVFSV